MPKVWSFWICSRHDGTMDAGGAELGLSDIRAGEEGNMKTARIIVLCLGALIFMVGCYEDRRYELASLFNDSQVKGSFFLGCGTIDSEEYLFAWAREANEISWKRIKMSSEYCRVFTDENEKPYAIETWNRRGDREYQIHIPANTIIKQFSLK
jgi:hypothetical protein